MWRVCLQNKMSEYFCSWLKCHLLQNESEGESEYSPYIRPWQRVKIPNLDLSDDDSSGVSSSNASLENFLYGKMNHVKYVHNGSSLMFIPAS